jgi:hypothetical protein
MFVSGCPPAQHSILKKGVLLSDAGILSQFLQKERSRRFCFLPQEKRNSPWGWFRLITNQMLKGVKGKMKKLKQLLLLGAALLVFCPAAEAAMSVSVSNYG